MVQIPEEHVGPAPANEEKPEASKPLCEIVAERAKGKIEALLSDTPRLQLQRDTKKKQLLAATVWDYLSARVKPRTDVAELRTAAHLPLMGGWLRELRETYHDNDLKWILNSTDVVMGVIALSKSEDPEFRESAMQVLEQEQDIVLELAKKRSAPALLEPFINGSLQQRQRVLRFVDEDPERKDASLLLEMLSQTKDDDVGALAEEVLCKHVEATLSQAQIDISVHEMMDMWRRGKSASSPTLMRYERLSGGGRVRLELCSMNMASSTFHGMTQGSSSINLSSETIVTVPTESCCIPLKITMQRSRKTEGYFMILKAPCNMALAVHLIQGNSICLEFVSAVVGSA